MIFSPLTWLNRNGSGVLSSFVIVKKLVLSREGITLLGACQKTSGLPEVRWEAHVALGYKTVMLDPRKFP